MKVYSVRWWCGLALLAVAMLCWLLAMAISPYTTMGVGPQYLRRSVADILMRSAGTVVLLSASAALVAFSNEDNRRGWSTIAFGVMLVFLAAMAVWRLAWL